MEPAVFVTEDKWMREGGVLDDIDIAVLKEASPNGKPKIMNLKEMLESLEKDDPVKYAEFKVEMNKQAGKNLTKDEIIKLGQAAGARSKEFDYIFAVMPKYIAEIVRAWRVDKHYSWRSVARAASRNNSFRLIFGRWDPPSNQLAGMSLCEKAASLLGENYRQPPWN